MAPSPEAGKSAGRSGSAFVQASQSVMIVTVAVFLAALVGSLSRPVGFLAVFWPANALLAGLIVRDRRFRNILSVAGATVGYIGAGVVVGDEFWTGILLTAANLAGVLTFAGLFGALDEADRGLNRPQGVISLIVMSAAAASAAGVVGAVASQDLTGVDYFTGWLAWFAAELVNYLAILPVVLTVPTWAGWVATKDVRVSQLRAGIVPILALVVIVAIATVIPTPIAVVLPVPVLIWCAMVLPMSTTCILVLLYSGLAMMGIKVGLFDLAAGENASGGAITAIHLGIALLALVPVVVASVASERRRTALSTT